MIDWLIKTRFRYALTLVVIAVLFIVGIVLTVQWPDVGITIGQFAIGCVAGWIASRIRRSYMARRAQARATHYMYGLINQDVQ